MHSEMKRKYTHKTIGQMIRRSFTISQSDIPRSYLYKYKETEKHKRKNKYENKTTRKKIYKKYTMLLVNEDI